MQVKSFSSFGKGASGGYAEHDHQPISYAYGCFTNPPEVR